MATGNSRQPRRTPALRLGRAIPLILVLAAAAIPAHAAEVRPIKDPPLRDQPPTAAPGEVGELLRRLDRNGRIAGNLGDIYDNRDRGHARLKLDWFPQLSQLVYNDQERETRADWALATLVRPGIVVGNSSTSAPPDRGGSNPRMMDLSPQGLRLGWLQYTHNNLYVYPEHRDFEPGVFGLGGAGDRLPFNTPYLLTSLGSSGSDQPLLRAAFWTLAALRPEVKSALAEHGMLMPAVQMILRRSLRTVNGPDAYLTGVAHPPVFDGDHIDPLAMIQMAHRLSANRLPPMARLAVVEETPSMLGRDYDLPNQTERWATTPGAICRVYRGPHPVYRMVLDAGDSVDPGDRPLTFHWSVLQGDPGKITIKPLDDAGRRVELRVTFHNRAVRVPAMPEVQSRRIDVGCFADNGTDRSAPAIVSVYMPAAQRITLGQSGRVSEVGQGAYALTLPPKSPPALPTGIDANDGDIPTERWCDDGPALLALLIGDTPHARLLREALPPADRDRLNALADRLGSTFDDLRQRRAQYQQAKEAADHAPEDDPQVKQQLDQQRRTAQGRRDLTQRRAQRLLRMRSGQNDAAPMDTALDLLRRLRDNPDFYVRLQDKLDDLTATGRAVRDRLVALGILERTDAGRFRRSQAPPSALAKNLLAALHECVLGQLCDGLLHEPEPLHDDPRLVIPHPRRDVYHHDAEGRLTGWTRYAAGSTQRFNSKGQLLPDTPNASTTPPRPVSVRYAIEGEDLWSARLVMHRVPDASPSPNPKTGTGVPTPWRH